MQNNHEHAEVLSYSALPEINKTALKYLLDHSETFLQFGNNVSNVE